MSEDVYAEGGKGQPAVLRPLRSMGEQYAVGLWIPRHELWLECQQLVQLPEPDAYVFGHEAVRELSLHAPGLEKFFFLFGRQVG